MAVGASQEDIEYIAQPLYSNPHQSKVIFCFSEILLGSGLTLIASGYHAEDIAVSLFL